MLSINTYTSIERFEKMTISELIDFIDEYIEVTAEMRKGGD